jgi:hypothetical protein
MSAQIKNETGNRYGRLLVLEKMPHKKGKERIRWRCRCDCGKETIVLGWLLRIGRAKSCGCWGHYKDETGNRYGKLLVLEKMPPRKKGGGYPIRWRCRCDCGKETIVCGTSLRNGNTKSCGCLRRGAPRKNEMGHKYGQLLVVKKSPRRINGLICWRCLCDCGKYATVTGDALRKGRATSCGCREKKKGKVK